MCDTEKQAKIETPKAGEIATPSLWLPHQGSGATQLEKAGAQHASFLMGHDPHSYFFTLPADKLTREEEQRLKDLDFPT